MKPEKAVDFFIQRAKRRAPNALFAKEKVGCDFLKKWQ